jgi:hypothetical protein
MKAQQNGGRSPLRLAVCVLQDVVQRETFDNYGDLKEAFKTRLAQLHVRYNAGLISDALEQLERGGRAPLVQLRQLRPRLTERTPEPAPDLSPADAHALIVQLFERFNARPS